MRRAWTRTSRRVPLQAMTPRSASSAAPAVAAKLVEAEKRIQSLVDLVEGARMETERVTGESSRLQEIAESLGAKLQETEAALQAAEANAASLGVASSDAAADAAASAAADALLCAIPTASPERSGDPGQVGRSGSRVCGARRQRGHRTERAFSSSQVLGAVGGATRHAVLEDRRSPVTHSGRRCSRRRSSSTAGRS